MTSVLSRSSALTARTKPTTGDTKTSFVNVDHLGWLNCNGRALDKVQYNLLFQVIGYTFGGSGNTFNLPDFQGRVQGSVGTIEESCDTTFFGPGQVSGEVKHKLTIAEMPAHNHHYATGSPGANTTGDGYTSSYTHSHGGNTGEAGQAAESETVVGTVTAVHTDAIVTGSGSHHHSISSDTHQHTIASNGGDQCHNNMQPTLTYGNTFIYCGVPMTGSFPFETRLSPVLI